MMYRQILLFHRLVILLFLVANSSIYSEVIGSNTAVSRQGAVTFPSADTDNEIRGFASMDNGFTFENSSTTCTYNDFFSVDGNITLNGGVLYLNQDLVLQEDAQIITVGTIDGNGHSLEFTTTTSILLPAGGGGWQVFNFITQADVSNDLRTLSWSHDDQFIAAGTEANKIKIYSFDGTMLTEETSQSLSRPITSVAWHPSDYLLATGMRQKPGAQDELIVWRYDSNTKVLTQVDGINVNEDIRAISWSPSGNHLAVGRNVLSAEINIYSVFGDTLSEVDSIDIVPNRTVSFDAIDWSPDGNYFVVGVTDSANEELLIYYFDGLSLTLTLDADPGGAVQAVDWSDTGTYIAVGLSSGSERLRVYEHMVANGTLTEITSARVGESESVLSVHWNSDGTELVMGRAAGTGTEFRLYSFSKTSGALSLKSSQDSFEDINTVRWSHDNQYIATGDNINYLNLYGFSTQLPIGDLIFKNIAITCNADLVFTNTVRFQGVCALACNDHALTLGTDGHIVVDTGSSLLLDQVGIKNLRNNKMRCLNSAGRISLRNVDLILDSDFSFACGHFYVQGDVRATGAYGFSYQSDQISTIDSHATLLFDSGITFSYEPTIASQALLSLQDSSSRLHFFETSLYVTTTGLSLTKGTVIIEGDCFISSDANVEVEGISLGTGIAADDNCTLKILPESNIHLLSGYLLYKNVE